MSVSLQTLYPHQITGVQFLVHRQRAILADDMGLGKTRQAIVADMELAPEGAVLVICPASLKLNWGREIQFVDAASAVEIIGVPGTPAGRPRWVVVNYDLLAREAARLRAVPWSVVIVDEAHFIKNASQRTARVLDLLGAGASPGEPGHKPSGVFLLTGTPMPSRPRDLFNLLRAVEHPAARSFISFAKRYCDAYRNDFGWVTAGASNLPELNQLLKEAMLRRTKDEVLDLPPKIRSFVPVALEGEGAARASVEFAEWFMQAPREKPNDTEFLARLTRLRIALHKAKHKACAERIRDVIATGRKVVVFCCYQEGITRHRKTLGGKAVTITGSDNVVARMSAVEAFQHDPEVLVALCNLVAGGVGITLTAGTHVIFQDLDWVPANHLQAEDRCYRLGQTASVTVEYLLGAGSLDAYIARLLDAKMALIAAVEAAEVPAATFLAELQHELQSLAPALLQEAKSLGATGEVAVRLEAIGAQIARLAPDSPLLELGAWEFSSKSSPGKVYRVIFGRAGQLQCDCPGFAWRGECAHVREARKSAAGS